MAYKDVDEDFFSRWKQQHHKASTALENREAQLDQLFEEIETDLLVSHYTGNYLPACGGSALPQEVERMAGVPRRLLVRCLAPLSCEC